MLVSQAAEAFIAHVTVERGLAKNTIAAYRRDLDRFCEWCDARAISSIQDVSEQRLREFITWCRDDGGAGFAASSTQRVASCVRGLVSWLAVEGHLPNNPGADLSVMGRALRLPKALTIDEVARLIACASIVESEILGLRNVALVEFLYATGARISEAVGLDVDDLDLAARSAVVTGKGSKQRRVPLGEIACSALEGWLVRGRLALAAAGTGSPRLFLTAHGKPMSRQAGFAVVRDAAQRAGIASTVGPHALRHSCATHLVEAGADVRVVQELLGHASVQTTQIYTLVTAQRLRETHAMAHPRAR